MTNPRAEDNKHSQPFDAVRSIRSAVEEINRISNQAWLDGLTERKRKELEFHNRDRNPSVVQEAAKSQDTYEQFYGNKKYYSATRDSQDYKHAWIEKHAKGKIFLDYACGNGAKAIEAAKAGASLSLGLDISDVSVSNAARTAEEQGVSGNTLFFQADAEDTKLPDSCVDTIICSGMLHHLDLSYAFPELRRILRPGGRLLAVEALDYNPFIKLYRKLTPDMRTEWEKAHILSLKDLNFADRFFEIGDVRYWHVTSYVAGRFPVLLGPLVSLDRVLTRIPGVRLLAWIFTFELICRDD